jgi:hypothetical protein
MHEYIFLNRFGKSSRHCIEIDFCRDVKRDSPLAIEDKCKGEVRP